MTKRVGKKGSGKESFNSPRQIAVSPEQHIYVADFFNNRLQILTTNLVFRGSLQHQSMTCPVDVKFSNKEMFVLSIVNNPCIHVFTLSGEKSRSLITIGEGMQITRAWFFCLDGRNNNIISDNCTHNIKVFSPEGNLLHTIGQKGLEAGMFIIPNGTTIHDTKLIRASGNFSLQIFSA